MHLIHDIQKGALIKKKNIKNMQINHTILAPYFITFNDNFHS